MTETLYDVLQVSPHADQDVIRAAYRSRIKAAHPDRGGDDADSARISEAYQVLSDERQRREYDEQLAALNAESDDEPAEPGWGSVLDADPLLQPTPRHDPPPPQPTFHPPPREVPDTGPDISAQFFVPAPGSVPPGPPPASAYAGDPIPRVGAFASKPSIWRAVAGRTIVSKVAGILWLLLACVPLAGLIVETSRREQIDAYSLASSLLFYVGIPIAFALIAVRRVRSGRVGLYRLSWLLPVLLIAVAVIVGLSTRTLFEPVNVMLVTYFTLVTVAYVTATGLRVRDNGMR